MRLFLLLCVVSALLPSLTDVRVADASERSARDIIEAYLQLPASEERVYGERSGRVEVLYQLKDMPDQAVPAIAEILPTIDHRVHRLELIEILGRIKTLASSEVLIPLLKHHDAEVRGKAVWSLRLHAMGTTRSGPTRRIHSADYPPLVEGLVPHLIAAADDEHEGVRRQALYALADTRDPAAHAKLRESLNDPDAKARFLAACFLTEFDDPAGMPELRKAITRFKHRSEEESRDLYYPAYYPGAQRLFASLERITGESMGRIPPDPMILSVPPPTDLDDRYAAMLDAWEAWFTERDGEKE